MADPVLRQQTPEPVAAGFSDYDETQGQQARFFNIFFGTEVIGGLQTYASTQRTGGRLMPQGGTDVQEYVGGARSFTIPGTRFCVRGNRIPDIVKKITGLPDNSDVDYRALSFTLYEHFLYESLTGKSTFENSQTGFYKSHITDYTYRMTDPEGLMMEEFNIIAQYYKYGSGGKTLYGRPVISVSVAADLGSATSDIQKGIVAATQAVNSAAGAVAAAAAAAEVTSGLWGQ